MAMKRSRPLLFSVMVTLLGAAGVWWGMAVPGPKAAPSASASSRAASSSAALSPDRLPAQKAEDGRRAWVPGMLYRHALLLDQRVAFSAQGKSAAAAKSMPNGMTLYLRGEWDVGIVSADGDQVETRIQLRPDSFSVLLNDQEPLDSNSLYQMKDVIGLPFFVTFDRNGVAQRTYFEKRVDVLGRGILRALVSSTQLMLPGVPQDSWQSEEHDPTGRYLSTYRRQGANRFEKQKQLYTHMNLPQGQVPVEKDITITVRSSMSFELAEDLWAESLEGTERLDIDLGKDLPASSNEFKLSLRLLERRREMSLLGALAARKDKLDSSAMSSFLGLHEDPLDHYRQILGDVTLEDVLKSLRSLPTEEGERNSARSMALEHLRAIFMLQPDEALKIPGLLREERWEPEAASPMLGALSAASTPQSLKALAEVTHDYSLSKDIRMDAIAALGVAEEPISEGVNTLRNLIRNEPDPLLRDTATLAFGNASLQLRDTDAQGAETLAAELMNDYRTGATPEQQSIALRGLGNTQSPSALATIEEALRSPHVLVREAAVTALRNIADPNADRLLSERLLMDPASEVRRAVLFAASFRPLGPLLPALAQALRSDASQGVRSDLVQLLGTSFHVEPAVLPLLVWASQNESHPDIRAAAQVYVNAATGAPPSPTP